MTIPTEVIMRMATLGLNEEQARAVADMLTAVEAATAAGAEAGKEKARARWRTWKERQSTNVGKRLQTTANVSKQLVHVEDKTLTSEIEPLKEEKKARRASRLPADWTLPVEWRIDAIEAGLPESRIDATALDMRDWSLSSPKGAKLDWRATWRTWCRRSASDQPRAGPAAAPPKPKQLADIFKIIKDTENGRQEREDRSGTGGVVSYLPAVGSR